MSAWFQSAHTGIAVLTLGPILLNHFSMNIDQCMGTIDCLDDKLPVCWVMDGMWGSPPQHTRQILTHDLLLLEEWEIKWTSPK